MDQQVIGPAERLAKSPREECEPTGIPQKADSPKWNGIEEPLTGSDSNPSNPDDTAWDKDQPDH